MSQDKIGFATLQRQLQAQQQIIDEIRNTTAPSPVPATPSDINPPNLSFASAAYNVKAQLADSKAGQATDALESIFAEFKRDMPSIDSSLKTLGTLVEYAVDFVEKYSPLMMQLLEMFATDTSPFKLNTCILLITSVLPPLVNISEGLITSMINTIVKLKNDIKAVTSKIPPPQQKSKQSTGKLAKVFHK